MAPKIAAPSPSNRRNLDLLLEGRIVLCSDVLQFPPDKCPGYQIEKHDQQQLVIQLIPSHVSRDGPLKREQVPAQECDNETVTSHAGYQTDEEEKLENLFPTAEKASSAFHRSNEIGNSSSKTADDRDASEPAVPASFFGGGHTRFSAHSGGSAEGSDTPRSSMGRGT
ncbi:hypothetical protein HPB51_026669 [Rhipicephalus microplus]|uniref:Uncharacterized protein n=1 Tax=Rhipicephalus microplus TaxID=6941 RepID=A0A9J6D2A3_RHIMP|nr:hypothetical protein HPB51_026669 [Rhipicephalus microplus]